MKIPSRYMPKYKEKPSSLWGWLVLVILVILLFWLLWEIPYLLLLAPILIIIDIWDRKKIKNHFSILLKGRENDSICTFTRHFECKEIDTWIIRAVYEQLQSYMIYERESFPINPNDDAFTDLMIDDEDFGFNIVEEIAQRTGRSLENAESNSYYSKVNIVENLVYFFNEQPKSNAT